MIEWPWLLVAFVVGVLVGEWWMWFDGWRKEGT